MKIKNITMSQFTEIMHNLSGAMMLIGQTLISAFFVVIILVLVLAVEIQRVAHGIELFEHSQELAYLGAFVLVMMLLTLEFIVHYVETKEGYETKLKSDFSLRILWRDFMYFFGFIGEWEARYKSPAHKIKGYSRLLTMTILALALGGSMADTISAVNGNWVQGLEFIALQSTLLEIVRWFGGLLFAVALVIGTQRLTSYVAQRASETLLASKGHSQENHHEPIIKAHKITVPEINPFMADWVVHPDDIYVSECPDCGWQSDEKTSQDSADRALRAHRLHCSAKDSIERLSDDELIDYLVDAGEIDQ